MSPRAISALTAIGFDADDTLWHNERVFRLTEERFAALLGAGEWSRRKEKIAAIASLPIANIPAILTAAGTAVAFYCAIFSLPRQRVG